MALAAFEPVLMIVAGDCEMAHHVAQRGDVSPVALTLLLGATALMKELLMVPWARQRGKTAISWILGL